MGFFFLKKRRSKRGQLSQYYPRFVLSCTYIYIDFLKKSELTRTKRRKKGLPVVGPGGRDGDSGVDGGTGIPAGAGVGAADGVDVGAADGAGAVDGAGAADGVGVGAADGAGAADGVGVGVADGAGAGVGICVGPTADNADDNAREFNFLSSHLARLKS